MIARLYADVGLPHLDRPFDYAIPPDLEGHVVPGCHVKVRFAGRRVDGWVTEVTDRSDVERLAPILRLVSPIPLVPARSARLFRAVADHCGGTFCDVLRLAVPPRHAATEKAFDQAPPTGDAEARPSAPSDLSAASDPSAASGSSAASDPAVTSGASVTSGSSAASDPSAPSSPSAASGPSATSSPSATSGPSGTSGSPLDLYPTGTGYLAAVAQGGAPRAAWAVVPTADEAGDWAAGLAAAAEAALASGRTAVLVVPDAKDADRLAAALGRRIESTLVARQTADLGPATRYKGFLRALTGTARVVVGTRAAAYTPLPDVGLVALWDDGDDSHTDPRAPYPHVRDVLALRAAQERAAFLVAGHSRSVEVQAWIEAEWCAPIGLAPAEARRLAPRTAVASQADRAQDFDPAATTARVPHDVFTVVRDALAFGPVLVHVPHAGFRRHLTCARCRTPLRCPCGGPLEDSSRGLVCAWDGRAWGAWTCPVCRSRQHRAATVGHRRQALELERAFPGVEVLKADGEHPVASAPDRPCLVVATPGAEPTAPGGYAAAVILDAAATLGRASLRAAEEAMRRWLQVTALVRPGSQSGSVILVGPAEDRTVQAWLRLDPAGHAVRELADRRATELPPACRMAEVKGDPEAVAALTRSLADGAPGPSSVTSGGARDLSWLVPLGPVPDPLDPERHRLFLRAPAARGRDLARVVHDLAAARSAAKAKGVVSFHVDPQDLA